MKVKEEHSAVAFDLCSGHAHSESQLRFQLFLQMFCIVLHSVPPVAGTALRVGP
jgi:hypothetical protein